MKLDRVNRHFAGKNESKRHKQEDIPLKDAFTAVFIRMYQDNQSE